MKQQSDKFKQDNLYTFCHIYFDKTQRLDVVRKANAPPATLHKTPNKDHTNIGQGYSFKPYFQATIVANFANVFGNQFSYTLASVATQNAMGH